MVILYNFKVDCLRIFFPEHILPGSDVFPCFALIWSLFTWTHNFLKQLGLDSTEKHMTVGLILRNSIAMFFAISEGY